MPAKKVARKTAKIAGGKSAHRSTHDLRRAYEHLGRIEILEGALVGSPFCEVTALANLAQQQLAAGGAREAADLLRAAEHLTFAALAPHSISGTVDAGVSSGLKAAIATEFEQLLHCAQQRKKQAPRDSEQAKKDVAASPYPTLSTVYNSTLEHARSAFAAAAYRKALELARAAEALGQVTAHRSAAVGGRSKLAQRLAS